MKRLIFFFLLLSNIASAQEDDLLALPKDIQPEDRICFALYTVHENTLKLTAQFYPIRHSEPFVATLEIEENGKWIKKATANIIYPGYTAPFRVENWDDTKELKYRVAHNNVAFYEGIIRKNPVDNEEFVMAAFTCNSIYKEHGGDISRDDIVENIKKLQPDLLFFSGDQVYPHSEHYLAWIKFGRDFREITRNTPTICIVDDHDVGQANIWGEGGIKADSRRGISGGFYMPTEYIAEVERAQTSHLPDAYDPTPIGQGIGVYYTDLKWGGISFAILEDRKFKSGLTRLAETYPKIFPEGAYEAIHNKDIDTRLFDLPELTLLGERQLNFLEDWTTDWENAEMKTVLSQTIFASANNYTGKQSYGEIFGDFDSNGWPQSGRNRALEVIRKSYSPMVAGDQHLGSVLQHGVDDWGDAGYSFCTPAIANLWMRWWEPSEPGKNHVKGQPNYTGDYYDAFHNRMSVFAVANPTLPRQVEGGKLTTRAAGFGVVRYNKTNRTITFDCWARNVDITNPESKQYNGWPITINQIDNFVIKKGFELPTLTISEEDQVVTVRKTKTNEVVSSLRINGKIYQPKVLEEGIYTIEVGEGKTIKRFHEIEAKKRNSKKIDVRF